MGMFFALQSKTFNDMSLLVSDARNVSMHLSDAGDVSIFLCQTHVVCQCLCQTQVMCAVDPVIADDTGHYYR